MVANMKGLGSTPIPKPIARATGNMRTADALLDTTAAKILHVGDHIENDIKAARRAGFYTAWTNFGNSEWDDSEPPSIEVRRIGDLANALANLEQQLLS